MRGGRPPGRARPAGAPPGPGRAYGAACLGVALLLAAGGCAADRPAGPVPAALCAPGTLDAQGSSAQFNAMRWWTVAYQRSCPGSTVNYEPSGSGAGIKAFVAGTADFVGSESLPDAEERAQADAQCSGGRVVSLPMVIGPVAVAYRLAGVAGLRLTPATLARIFAGTVTRWDDPAIRSDNPGVPLPAIPVRTVHRSDSSGTTETFTRFLAETAPGDWPFGTGRTWTAPGGSGAPGSERVAERIEKRDGTIGYLELSYARQEELSIASVRNGRGQFVVPSGEAAVKSVVEPHAGLRVGVDVTGREDGAYPVVLVTYEIVCDRGLAADEAPLVRGFLGWAASAEGQRGIAALGYAALPETLRGRVAATAARIA